MRSAGEIAYNFHWIVPGEAARAAQAWGRFLGPFLKARGVKSIVNLRGTNSDLSWWRRETQTARALGIAHFDAMLDSRKLPTREMLLRLMTVFDAAPRPLLVKCSGGQDRTGFAAALFLIHRGGWAALPQARGQFARFPFLHFPKRNQRWLRHFLDFAAEDSRKSALGGWVADGYDPQCFKAWLDARGLGDSHAGIFEKPKRSPFQW